MYMLQFRETPTLTIVQQLLQEGARIAIYDPVVEPSQMMSDFDYCQMAKGM